MQYTHVRNESASTNGLDDKIVQKPSFKNHIGKSNQKKKRTVNDIMRIQSVLNSDTDNKFFEYHAGDSPQKKRSDSEIMRIAGVLNPDSDDKEIFQSRAGESYQERPEGIMRIDSLFNPETSGNEIQVRRCRKFLHITIPPLSSHSDSDSDHIHIITPPPPTFSPLTARPSPSSTLITNGSTLGGVDPLHRLLQDAYIEPAHWAQVRRETAMYPSSPPTKRVRLGTPLPPDPEFYDALPLSTVETPDLTSGFDVEMDPVDGPRFWWYLRGAWERNSQIETAEERREKFDIMPLFDDDDDTDDDE